MEHYMQRALELAGLAYELGEVPVGAVVVNNATDEIIGEGYNLREKDSNPLAHAEIIAIKQASESLKAWRLMDCTIYVTLEPCPMCCGAIINSRIDKVVFGAYDPKAGCCSSIINLFELPFNHKPVVQGGFMEQECSEILSKFFQDIRKRKGNA